MSTSSPSGAPSLLARDSSDRSEAVARLLELARNPVIAAMLEAQCPGLDEYAPDFTLPSGAGAPVSLDGLLAQGHVVVLFHHGSWCGPCLATVRDLAAQAAQITTRRARVVAISPSPGRSIAALVPGAAPGDLLQDSGGRIACLFGLAVFVPAEAVDLVDRAGIDLPRTGSGASVLPIPAMLVVRRDGLVTFAVREPDHVRPLQAADILVELDRLGAAIP